MFHPRKYRHHIEPPRLNLTAMVDVFTVLLLFLLKSYAAEGTELATMRNLQLPPSTSRLQQEALLTVTVTTEAIFVQGKLVLENKKALEGKEPMIPELADSLREYSEGIDSEHPSKGKMTIISDRRITFRLLERIIMTASEQGWDNISFVVLQNEKMVPEGVVSAR